jgi:hypothetical protein
MTATLDEPRVSYARRKVERLRADIEEWGNAPRPGEVGVLEDMIRDTIRFLNDLAPLFRQVVKTFTAAQDFPSGEAVAVTSHMSEVIDLLIRGADGIRAHAERLPKLPEGLDELKRHREAARAADPHRLAFEALAERWKAETAFLSSPDEIAAHWAYQRIVALGAPMVPFVLGELRREPNLWFAALRALTGANPVPAEARGKVRAMAEAWVRWGEANQLI